MCLAKAIGFAGMALSADIGLATTKTVEPYPGVIGSDDRKPLAEPEAFWSAVGKIEIAGFSWLNNCTGTLVASDIVITAAHCLVDRRMSKRVAAERVRFAAGLVRDKVAGRGAARCVAYLGDMSASPTKPTAEDFRRDAAAVFLRKPLDIAPLPLSDEALVTGAKVTHAGYGRDRRYVLSVHRDCKIVDHSRMLYLTDCDTNLGQSGGPVLVEKNGTAQLAGIMVGYFDEGSAMLGVDAWRELIKAPECAAP